ncbi:hypothetical protein [Pseudomonas sp. PS01300]|uniref:hypothetical protein n=1 Tax=Pseudomonas sp. PS01300 TaxID=2991436 RepID=UPI00249AABA9|nr:hypothetical protein [Pseudomonas sp. PS01300]
MSSPANIGNSITDAVNFVARLGGECERLTDLIKQEVSRALLTPDLAKRYKANGAWIDVSDTDEHGWVCTDVGISLPIAAKPKRLTSSYVVIQISLTGVGIEALGNHEPLVHIGQWGHPIDLEEIQMGFPCDLDSGYELSLEEGRLFKWVHSGYETEWCYSVRLTDLNCPDDVKINIIDPLKSLLLGCDVAQALSGTAAVQYVEVVSNEGQYRVIPRS